MYCTRIAVMVLGSAFVCAGFSQEGQTGPLRRTRLQPRLDLATAESLALAQHPGAVVSAVLKRNRSGLLVYAFQIQSTAGEVQVTVNAITGEVIRPKSGTETVQLQERHRSKMDRREWHNH